MVKPGYHLIHSSKRSSNSRDIEAVVRDRCFFVDIDFVVVTQGSRRDNLPISQFMANTMVQILSLSITPFVSYTCFSKRL